MLTSKLKFKLKYGATLLAVATGLVPALLLIPGCSGGASGTSSGPAMQTNSAQREAEDAATTRIFFSSEGTLNTAGEYVQTSGSWLRFRVVPHTPTPVPTVTATATGTPPPSPEIVIYLGTYQYNAGPQVGQHGDFTLYLRKNTARRTSAIGSPRHADNTDLVLDNHTGTAVVTAKVNSAAGTGTGKVTLSNGSKGPITITSKVVIPATQAAAFWRNLPRQVQPSED